jgi:hypothetical protein
VTTDPNTPCAALYVEIDSEVAACRPPGVRIPAAPRQWQPGRGSTRQLAYQPGHLVDLQEEAVVAVG